MRLGRQPVGGLLMNNEISDGSFLDARTDCPGYVSTTTAVSVSVALALQIAKRSGSSHATEDNRRAHRHYRDLVRLTRRCPPSADASAKTNSRAANR
jgi:hypothetical protein